MADVRGPRNRAGAAGQAGASGPAGAAPSSSRPLCVMWIVVHVWKASRWLWLWLARGGMVWAAQLRLGGPGRARVPPVRAARPSGQAACVACADSGAPSMQAWRTPSASPRWRRASGQPRRARPGADPMRLLRILRPPPFGARGLHAKAPPRRNGGAYVRPRRGCFQHRYGTGWRLPAPRSRGTRGRQRLSQRTARATAASLWRRTRTT
jgi:hypothetical protein